MQILQFRAGEVLVEQALCGLLGVKVNVLGGGQRRERVGGWVGIKEIGKDDTLIKKRHIWTTPQTGNHNLYRQGGLHLHCSQRGWLAGWLVGHTLVLPISEC